MATRRRSNGLLWALIIVLLMVLAAGIFGILRLQTGSALPKGGGWVSTEAGMQYLGEDKTPVTGWQQIDGTRFYFREDGILATGWQEIQGNRHYFGRSGVPNEGWQVVDGQRLCFDASGRLLTDWQIIDGQRYYLGQDGIAATGVFEVDGQRYWADAAGILLTGWQQTDQGTIYLGNDGILHTGWQEIDGRRYYMDPETGVMAVGKTELDGKVLYFDSQGGLQTGWQEIEGKRRYFYEDGSMAAGWAHIGEHRFYFTEDQGMALGWLELDGHLYYFKEDGVMAIGQITVDGVDQFFSSQGYYTPLVNYKYPSPAHLEEEMVDYGGRMVHKSAYEALAQMVADCRAAGNPSSITEIYRSEAGQRWVWDRRVNAYLDEGYDRYTAEQMAAWSIAVPGYSEHHTGLALDFNRDEPGTLAWINEHCWDYGFILRYPSGKSDITKINYEPWHFRYVGVEVAQELKESGLCLEEYFRMLNTQEAQKAPPQ